MKRTIATLATALTVTLPAAAAGEPKSPASQVGEPGVAAAKAVKVTAMVLAVDVPNRVLTLRGPNGNVFSVTLGKEVKSLPQVKAGDRGWWPNTSTPSPSS